MKEKAILLFRRFLPAPYLFALLPTFVSAFLAIVITRMALPIVSIADLSAREMMGYCLVALAIAFPLFGAALLLF